MAAKSRGKKFAGQDKKCVSLSRMISLQVRSAAFNVVKISVFSVQCWMHIHLVQCANPPISQVQSFKRGEEEEEGSNLCSKNYVANVV